MQVVTEGQGKRTWRCSVTDREMALCRDGDARDLCWAQLRREAHRAGVTSYEERSDYYTDRLGGFWSLLLIET